MFEKSLQDIVRGIRDQAKDPTEYINGCLTDIRKELSGRDMALKATALQKLTYLNMLGYDASWAAFNVIEVMSQQRFAFKRIGYLAASQTFTDDTDVVLLATQTFKREFQAKDQYEVGLAVNCLANIVTKDLSRDLLNDVTMMLTSSRPYVRKKATLVLYKLFVKYPQGLRLVFDQLKRRLTDDNGAVVSCAVHVICELAQAKPSNYLSLAPDLFKLLKTSHSNWMLIKVVKLLAALVGEEPRLARKLLAPLADIVTATPAKSLMYECIHTITECLLYTKKADGSDAKNAPQVVRLCTDKLRELVKDMDQNLKYLGLVGLVNLMRSHPRVVAEHRELVQQCLTDPDTTIRLQALELISGMVTRRNLADVVKRLLEHVADAEGHYRDALIEKIVFICSRDKFSFLTDFAWYLTVLVKLAYIKGAKHGKTLGTQVLSVAVRVPDVRKFAVAQMVPLLCDTAAGSIDSMARMRYSAAWIVGEYSELLEPTAYEPLFQALTSPVIKSFHPTVQAVYLQCALKVLGQYAVEFANGTADSSVMKPFEVVAQEIANRLTTFARSVHVEVQERAFSFQQLLKMLGANVEEVAAPVPPAGTADAAAPAATAPPQPTVLIDLFAAPPTAAASAGADVDPPSTADAPAAAAAAPPTAPVAGAGEGAGAGAIATLDAATAAPVFLALREGALKAVKANAQKHVTVPAGLDLDAWINKPTEEDSELPTVDSVRVSFAESYDNQDDEYSGHQAGAAAGSGAPQDVFTSMFGGDDDEDLFAELAGRASTGSSKGGSGSAGYNPYMLGASEGGAADVAEDDVDDIPIHELSMQELKEGESVEHIIAGAGKKDRRSRGESMASADLSVDAPSTKVKYTVESDDDMPAGYNSESSDDAPDAGDPDASINLSQVDLSTPLAPDEVMPMQTHHTVSHKKDKKGKKSKKEKKEKKSKKEKKAKKEKEGDLLGMDGGDGKKKHKKHKKHKDAGGDAAGAGAGAGAGVDAAPAGPVLAPVAETAPAHAAKREQLMDDKHLRVSFYSTVTQAMSDITTADVAVAAVVRLNIVCEGRSKRKDVDYVDITLGAVAGAEHSASAAVRVAKALPRKSKDKKARVSQEGAVDVKLSSAFVSTGATFPATITYAVEGGSPVTVNAQLALRAGALLVPVAIDVKAYQSIMSTPPCPLFHHASTLAVGGEYPSAHKLVKGILSLLPSFAMQSTETSVVTFARTFLGHPVTLLMKPQGETVALAVKSFSEDHVAALLHDVAAGLQSP